MARIFTTLSASQEAAIGKPCNELGCIGTYHKVSGKFGPFVSCDRYPKCHSKVMRRTNEPNEAPDAPKAPEQQIDNETSPDSPIVSGEPIKPTKEEPNMPQSGSLEQTIINLVKPTINAALAEVQTDASKVLQIVQDEMAKLQALKPTIIEIKRDDAPPTKIEGAHFNMERLIRLISAGIPVYTWGPPGTGKSTAALQAAEALGLYYEVDTLDPTTTRSMIQGFMDATRQPSYTAFSRCYTGEGVEVESGKNKGGLYIGEEIDCAPASVQSLKNTAYANGHSPFAWGMRKRGEKFGGVYNGNTPGRPTREFPERKPMSAAFLDRLYFMYWGRDENITRRATGRPLVVSPTRDTRTCSPGLWSEWCDKILVWKATNAPTLMVTDRAVHVGIRAMAAGEGMLEVAHGMIFRGADEEIVSKALRACPLLEGK